MVGRERGTPQTVPVGLAIGIALASLLMIGGCQQSRSWLDGKATPLNRAVPNTSSVKAGNSAFHTSPGKALEQPTPEQPLLAIQLAQGKSHRCALKSDGTVWCWGDNSHGQLGDGTKTKQSLPVKSKLMGKVVQISAGDSHSCAVIADGAVWCWGSNIYGQLGDGTSVDQASPVRVSELREVKEISLGNHHSCARNRKGRVWCWGDNSHGQVGAKSKVIQVFEPYKLPQFSGAIQVSSGPTYSCARRSNGTVWCWGLMPGKKIAKKTKTKARTPGRVKALGHASNVVTGDLGTFVISKTGRVFGMVADEKGNLGKALKSFKKARQIAVAKNHVCARKADGAVWCFPAQAVPEASSASKGAPVPGLKDVVEIQMKDSQACARKANGTVWEWSPETAGGIQINVPITRGGG
jgi:hypothetical protein